MSTNPPSTPTETAKVPTPAPAEKITLDAKDKIADLKSKLEIKTADPAKQKEIAQIEAFFKQKKDEILTISKTSIDSLKKDIEDKNDSITGKLDVKDGELVHTEVIADSASTSPETTPTEPAKPETPVNLGDVMTQVPESYQKEVKNHIVNNGGFAGMVMKGLSNWVTEIIKGIKGFFATFGIEDEGEKKDALAQINGFEDAEEERRVTSSVKALKTSPVTKGPPLSDLLKISHISNEELTKILKDNPGLDFSSTKNIEAAFSGSYLASEKEPMTRYLRIYTTLGNLHANPPLEYKPKEIFTQMLSGSNDTTLKINIPASPSLAPVGESTENAPTSTEAQTELRTKAVNLDEALIKAEAMPSGTPEEKSTKESAVKSAQEAATKFKEERKNTILTEYTDIKDGIKEGEIERDTLMDRNSPEESEKKKLEEVNKNLTRLRGIESALQTKMNEIMTQNDEKWEIKNGINAEKMASVEITISAIEDNTAAVEDQGLSEKEKETQEKEKKKELEDNQRILDADTVISDQKMGTIQEYLEKYPNPDLQEKFEIMKSKIALVKMTVSKKNQMKAENRFINWSNTDDDARGGWVEIENEHSGGSYLEEKSWLELDPGGLGQVDWQLVQGDNYHVKKVGGLWNARKILNDNKNIIKNSDDPENLKI